MDAFIGELRLFPYTQFVPESWAACEGQTCQIAQYQALYSIIGTRFGGDGRTNFMLPDLRARAAPGAGDDPYDTFDPRLGQAGGRSGVSLTVANMPPHTHSLSGAQSPAATRKDAPAGNLFTQMNFAASAGGGVGSFPYAVDPSPVPVTLHPDTLSPFAGGGAVGAPHENRQPFLAMRWCICFDGIYPPRP